jgi:hypothetical protein
MTVDDVIHDFAHTGSTLPVASMRWALDNWEAAAPRFIELLNHCANGLDRTKATKSALFFVIHLLGEKHEAKAFPALCRLLESAEDADEILGEAITETLSGVLISTYNGDRDALKRVIESTAADEFVRGAALDAMAYLARTGVLADGEMRAYLLHLRANMQPQAANYAWAAWADSAANLGYGELAGEVEKLIRRGFVPRGVMNMDSFNRQLRRALDDPEGLGGFDYDRAGPFTDTIGTFSTWYGFSEQYRLDQERLAARREEAPLEEVRLGPSSDAPYINPLRNVGRNDPCPCGSGKKFKNCCLQ